MKVLIACEESQVITEQFILRGHDARSCDIVLGAKGLPCYWGDVRDLLREHFDLVIFHPVCRYLANSGVRWLYSKSGRWEKMREGCNFFNLRNEFNSPRVCTENPIPHKFAVEHIGRYDQIIYPWEHGHKEMKRTCLWLKNLPELVPSNNIGKPPRNRDKREWDRVHRAPPGPERERMRSRTLEGIAIAMADQWGNLK